VTNAKPKDTTPMKPSSPTDSGSRPMENAMTVSMENDREHSTASSVIISLGMICVSFEAL